jgi:hypothetical protein
MITPCSWTIPDDIGRQDEENQEIVGPFRLCITRQEKFLLCPPNVEKGDIVSSFLNILVRREEGEEHAIIGRAGSKIGVDRNSRADKAERPHLRDRRSRDYRGYLTISATIHEIQLLTRA